MTPEEEEIREEFRRRRPKHPPPFNRGGPVQRNPEDVVVEMILEERAASKSTLETYIAGAEAQKQKLIGASFVLHEIVTDAVNGSLSVDVAEVALQVYRDTLKEIR